jgi:hypothetical protein
MPALAQGLASLRTLTRQLLPRSPWKKRKPPKRPPRDVKPPLGKLDWREDCQHLCRVRLENVVHVTQPLVLTTQVARSGGTLLSQLLDMHPQCHAHPYELYIGYPHKENWPSIRLEDKPEVWFQTLYEEPAFRAFREGYCKQPNATDQDRDLFPFLFLPSLQKAIFEQMAAATRIGSVRDVLNCYFTSYFNAWIDNRNLAAPWQGGDAGVQKKWVTAFVPRLIMDPANLDQFFAAYPDGRLISIVRDPRSWYVSFRVHKQSKKSSYNDMDKALSQWIASAESIAHLKAKYGDKVRVLRFDDLLGQTEGVVRELAAWLGIEFTASLLTPTFNGFPIKANSSFKVQSYGVSKEPVERWKRILTPEEIAHIDGKTAELFERVQALAQRPKEAAAA